MRKVTPHTLRFSHRRADGAGLSRGVGETRDTGLGRVLLLRSFKLLRLESWKLRSARPSEESVREVSCGGECSGEDEVEVGDEAAVVVPHALGTGAEEAHWSLTNRWRKVLESRASTLRLEADRLDSRALAELQETGGGKESTPSGGPFFRPGVKMVVEEGRAELSERLEKVMFQGSERLLLLLLPRAYTGHRPQGKRGGERRGTAEGEGLLVEIHSSTVHKEQRLCCPDFVRQMQALLSGVVNNGRLSDLPVVSRSHKSLDGRQFPVTASSRQLVTRDLLVTLSLGLPKHPRGQQVPESSRGKQE
ncbi:hypothetical protein AAFF_G00052960 [Aldrovandia affinis]|uniref:Uncharacterized protein n=1 Tax=Aldrovandia affinis TaxID=143900 RepID=A0AAD7T6I5_9TELE|nr:hypothetical protein AAFF_G00052960 [Aldrovandia affinis]